MDLSGKRVLVVGLGKSGVASALFLKARGARVTVSDTKTEDQLRAAYGRKEFRDALEEGGVEYHEPTVWRVHNYRHFQ